MSPFSHAVLKALDFDAIVSNRRRNFAHFARPAAPLIAAGL